MTNDCFASTPAGDVEKGAGHIGSSVADQPNGRLGDFLGRAGTPERRGRAQDMRTVRLAAAGVDFGVDETRGRR